MKRHPPSTYRGSGRPHDSPYHRPLRAEPFHRPNLRGSDHCLRLMVNEQCCPERHPRPQSHWPLLLCRCFHQPAGQRLDGRSFSSPRALLHDWRRLWDSRCRVLGRCRVSSWGRAVAGPVIATRPGWHAAVSCRSSAAPSVVQASPRNQPSCLDLPLALLRLTPSADRAPWHRFAY